jgi:hypothetical protein
MAVVRPIPDFELTKKLYVYYLTRNPVEIDAISSQMFDLYDLYKSEVEHKILGEKKTLFDYTYIKDIPYCDMKATVRLNDGSCVITRISIDPYTDDKSRHGIVGVMLVYNSNMNEIIGKFPTCGCVLKVTKAPTSKFENILECDWDQIFVTANDTKSYGRFLNNTERIANHSEEIKEAFNQLLHKIWLPIIKNRFNDFKKYPSKPKKPDSFICTYNANEAKKSLMIMIFERMTGKNADDFSISDIYTPKMRNKFSEKRLDEYRDFVHSMFGDDSNDSSNEKEVLVIAKDSDGKFYMDKKPVEEVQNKLSKIETRQIDGSPIVKNVVEVNESDEAPASVVEETPAVEEEPILVGVDLAQNEDVGVKTEAYVNVEDKPQVPESDSMEDIFKYLQNTLIDE